ncbi:hypothetical protein Plec18167_009189 [Paecilomyces lecythidis]|uniref:F-box domain-containing protein n=1 Tax=Paecilomyces lecythidis TaxID=3004212 RepID=A0ABR3WRJ8_9EURO
MPSESTAVSPHTTLDSAAADALFSSQHGDDLRDQPVSDHLLCGEVGDHGQPSWMADTSMWDSAEQDEGVSLRRVSPGLPAEQSSSIDCIRQYESSSMSSERKQTDLSFKVMPSSNRSRVSIEDFPNEVLTHIISHLPPSSLSSITLVSRRLHNLVTTPHAWRMAFSRYFPGPDSIESRRAGKDHPEMLRSEKRFFTRLTALASWRSEYILRTRLLRSLARGKPAQFQPPGKHGTVRSASVQNGSAVITYTSQLLYPVSHIDGNFGTGLSKKQPKFIHGAVEQGFASASDPSMGKVGSWGLSDHQMFQHFADLYPGDAQYGLGPGNTVGVPNSMDVSQPYGMVYGEGCPQGRTYFLSSDEQRGRFLSVPDSSSHPQLGIPALNAITTAVCSVWIAKSAAILKMTNGLIGLLSGSSSGILTAYSLGTNAAHERRFERGQVTARWVLCPGVPIIGIAVDENYTTKRHSSKRIWAVVLNALGELFYLTELPVQPEPSLKLNAEQMEKLAWKTGRSVRWELIEASRRIARPDPYNTQLVDGSYSPRSSSDSMGLDENQVAAETKEIEKFLTFKPKHFRKVCQGWNMRRHLKVDFAGDDLRGAGESVVVIDSGLDEEHSTASIRRLTRTKLAVSHESSTEPYPRIQAPKVQSLFGGPISESTSPLPGTAECPSRTSTYSSEPVSVANTEWRISDFVFGDRKSVQITCSGLDHSNYALLTVDEDPLLSMSGCSSSSSPMSSPMPHMDQPSAVSEIPGQRARYLAVGTTMGTVYVWDVRSPSSGNAEIINSVSPVRLINTDSPQVSCVALTSLYLVHGGNDGLVQAWDTLASSTRPIRTMNSRFSSRARRRLIQAEASIQGVGNNYFAASALCLDPDPTVLRGIVSLGTHLRYWAYSSSAADQYKSSKRRLRRSLRGNNGGPEGQRFTSSGRGALRDHIVDEKMEMERQKVADAKERRLLSGRFGIDLLGPDASEEELLAYAQMLSEEAYTSDERKRRESTASPTASTSDSTVGPNDSSFPPREFSSSSSPNLDTVEEELDPDIAEALRLSLLDNNSGTVDMAAFDAVPVKHAMGSNDEGHASSSPEQATPGSSRQQEMDDLEFALQLSLAEEKSREEAVASGQDEFPALSTSPSSSRDKGKGRA